MVDLRELIFPMPETVWDEVDFIEELIWIPYPSISFDTIKHLYNDELMDQEEEFLEKHKDQYQNKRYFWGPDNNLMRRTLMPAKGMTKAQSILDLKKEKHDGPQRVSIAPVKPSVARKSGLGAKRGSKMEIGEIEGVENEEGSESDEEKDVSYFDRTQHPVLDELGEQRLERAKQVLGKNVHHYIPCFLHMPYEIVGEKIIVYFHANGEDIGLCYNFCDKICHKLKVSLS